MKHIFHTLRACLALICSVALTASCSDDDKAEGAGQPVITVAQVAPAQFGDSITLHVNCRDEAGVALSTLKASLSYSQEEVQQVTLRTKTEGDYTLRLYVPFRANVPDGTAKLRLTLQDIHFATAEQTLDLPLSRPRYDHLTLVTSTGERYQMLPSATDPNEYHARVSSPTSKTVLAYVVAPKVGAQGNEITFGQGNAGVTEGVTDNISFVNGARGSFDVSFNTLTYAYAPVYDPAKASQELVFSAEAPVVVADMVQGRRYEFVGHDDFQDASWYYDRDYFDRNDNGTFTFRAVSGKYQLEEIANRRQLNVFPVTNDKPYGDNNKNAADWSNNGQVWIIGSGGLAKPSYSVVNFGGWWTDPQHALAMARISDKVFQLTLTVGKELKATDVNFKFFGQAGWGTEWKGTAGEYSVRSTSDLFKIGDGNGHDNGNIYVDGTLHDGETYVLTLDLTAGPGAAVMSVERR